MPRRIEIELTSARDDGSFTWRAAGAKLPKGVVGPDLLYPGAKTGDVVRADAEQGVDGIEITGVVAPPAVKAATKQRVEIVGSGRGGDEGVVTNLAPKRGGDRDRDRDRGDRPGGDRRPSRDGERRPPRDGDRRPPRDGERRPAGDRPDRGPRPGTDARGPRRDGAPTDRPGGRPGRPPAVKAQPASTHRDAAVADLEPGDQAIATEWLRGGIQAVRKAALEQNEANKAEGKPEVKPELLVGRAEGLIPALREAKWRDEAEATLALVDQVALRDLRAVVTSADGAARADEARALASDLRAALERRTAAQRDAWTAEITTALEEHRIVRALNLSGRAPDPATRLAPELAERLAAAASQAMNAEAKPGTWSQLLAAVVDSPVRRSVKPVALPNDPGPALLSEAKQAAGRVPALGKMLGVAIPPPPGARPKLPDAPAAALVADAAPADVPADAAPADAAPADAAPADAMPADGAPADAAPAEPAAAPEAAASDEPAPSTSDAPA